MKTTRIHILLAAIFAALLLCVIPVSAFAQDAAPAVVVTPVLPAEASNFILELLFKLAAAHPWVATIITVIGSMRVWAKPVFAAIHSIIEITPTTYDDGLWAMAYRFFTENPVGKSIAWLLDYLASVKIAPPAKPAEPSV